MEKEERIKEVLVTMSNKLGYSFDTVSVRFAAFGVDTERGGVLMEFVRCPLRFDIRGIVFKCDLKKGHSGQCISFPDGSMKLATVMWPKSGGF